MNWCGEAFYKICVPASCVCLRLASIHKASEELISNLGKLRGKPVRRGEGVKTALSRVRMPLASLAAVGGDPALCGTSMGCSGGPGLPLGLREEHAWLGFMCLELSTDLWGRQIAQTQVSEKSNIKAQREDENEGKPSSRELGMYSDGPQNANYAVRINAKNTVRINTSAVTRLR